MIDATFFATLLIVASGGALIIWMAHRPGRSRVDRRRAYGIAGAALALWLGSHLYGNLVLALS